MRRYANEQADEKKTQKNTEKTKITNSEIKINAIKNLFFWFFVNAQRCTVLHTTIYQRNN